MPQFLEKLKNILHLGPTQHVHRTRRLSGQINLVGLFGTKYLRKFENPAVGIAITNYQGDVLALNHTMMKMCGYSIDEYPHVPVWEGYANPEDRQRFVEIMRKEGKVENFEVQMRHKNGSLYWSRHFSQPIRYKRHPALLTTLEDITDLKQKEEELRERLKDLTCLYAVHRDIQQENSNEILFEKVLKHLLPAMRYPDITCPEITIGKKHYHTDTSRKPITSLQADIRVGGKVAGQLKVGYSEERAFQLPEEQNLINSVAEALSIWMERKRSEDALHQSEYRYRNISEATDDAICRWSTDGTLTFTNARYRELHGLISEDTHNLTWIDFAPKSERHMLENIFEALVKKPRKYSHEYPIEVADGSLCWLSWHHIPIIDNQGVLQEFQSVGRDITERKLTEENLQRSELQFRSIYEETPIGIELYDHQGVLYHANRSCLSIYGISDLDSLKKYRLFTDPNLTASQIEKLQDSHPIRYTSTYDFNKNRPRNIPTTTRTGIVNLDVQITPLNPDSKLGAIGFLVQIQDITEQKRSEQLQDQLAQAQKMESVGRLAGGVAHDFNNMLGIILGHAEEALQNTQLTEEITNNLKEILKASKRSSDLTRQLLAFARKQTILPQVIDLNKTVNGMLSMLQRLIGEEVTLILKPGDDLWPLKMDRSQIDQIMANLCANARDAIKGTGEIQIHTQNKTLSQTFCIKHSDAIPGDYVVLEFCDNGCGMTEDTVDRLFEPFFTTKEQGEGTGLGMATVYGIVKQNKGFIEVKTKPQQGTRFMIYFPRYTDSATQPEQFDTQTTPLARGETILLVEDDSAYLDMVEMLLKSLGYHVLPASQPATALRLAEENSGKIDLVLTDVIMPVMNGKELANLLTSRYPKLKHLFMSGYTADIIASHDVSESDQQLIRKPFSKHELALKLQNILNTTGSAS